MSDEKITLFLADDSEIVVEGITILTSLDPSIRIVGCCDNGLQVLDKVRAAKPDVLVLDISLPGLNGLEVCPAVKAELPKTAILMLSMNANERCVLDALQRGASGYLAKETVAEEFCQAVHSIARGEVYLGQGIPKSVLDKIERKEPEVQMVS